MVNNVPSYLSYSSVVSRETVRLSFMVASLNNLEILAADVGNAYLNATPKEKVLIILNKDIFGPELEGRYANIVRSLYGLKTNGAAW